MTLFKNAVINLIMTTRCNAWDLQSVKTSPGICRFCYRDRERVFSDPDRLERVIDAAVSKLGAERFVLTGGEALLSPLAPQAARSAASRGCQVNLHTNGLLLEELYKEILPYVDVFVLAVDGATAEYADWERGIGYFERFTKNIETLRRDEQTVGINSFISPHGFTQLDALGAMVHDLADSVDIAYWLVSQYRDSNRGSERKRLTYRFPPERFMQRLEAIADRHERFVLFRTPAEYAAARARPQQLADRITVFAQPTRAAEDPYPFRLWLSAAGTVTVDSGVDEGDNVEIGNIVDDDFDDLLRRLESQRSTTRQVNGASVRQRQKREVPAEAVSWKRREC